jgi:hypothetical protein
MIGNGLCSVMGSSSNSVISWVVVVMAALSLFSMICMLQIDRIVQGELASFGLRFSNLWVLPYSTMTRLVFLFGWLNIAAAVSVHMYTLAFKRGEVRQLVTEVEAELAKKRASVPASEKLANDKPTNEIIVRENVPSEKQPAQPVQNEQESPIVAGITPEELKQQV